MLVSVFVGCSIAMQRQIVSVAVRPDQGIGVDANRFVRLLSPGGCARPIFDEVLRELAGCVVAPTLGSILPYWLLVLPRVSCANFVQWRAETGIDPQQLVSDVLSELEVGSDQVIWFEHGAASYGSPVACGVDHAHLHIVIDPPFSFDRFISTAQDSTRLNWQEQTVKRAYESIGEDVSYLVAASQTRAVVAKQVEAVGSQFFRRVAAHLVGQSDGWNYRTHPYLENVQKTVRAFGSQSARLVFR